MGIRRRFFDIRGMDNDGLKFVGILFLLAFVVGITCLVHKSDMSDMNDWAAQNGYVITFQESRVIHTGPFWKGKNERVFYARVRPANGDGPERGIYFRFGHLFSGTETAWE